MVEVAKNKPVFPKQTTTSLKKVCFWLVYVDMQKLCNLLGGFKMERKKIVPRQKMLL